MCFSVKGPELINMYVGQSEQNIREGNYMYNLVSVIGTGAALIPPSLPSLGWRSIRCPKQMAQSGDSNQMEKCPEHFR